MPSISINTSSIRTDAPPFTSAGGLAIALLVATLLLPDIVVAGPTKGSSLEVHLRIGTDDGSGGALLPRRRHGGDDSVKVLSSGIAKRPARHLRRVQLSESHIAVEGLDSSGEVLYRDSLIDPRLLRSESSHGKRFGRTDFYRATADLHVALPNDPRIVTLRLSRPHWNGVSFDLESVAVLPTRKLR